jgi:hypothetical protein
VLYEIISFNKRFNSSSSLSAKFNTIVDTFGSFKFKDDDDMDDVITGVVLLLAKNACVDDVERFVELLDTRTKM